MAELRTPADAAAAAGFTGDASNAHKLLKRAGIAERIRELQAEAAAFADVRRQRIVVQLDQIASANIGDYFESVQVDGRWVERPKPLHALTVAQRAAIASYEHDPKTGTFYVKLLDKLPALLALLRYIGPPEPPAPPMVNVFDSLSADEQRTLADALQHRGDGSERTGRGSMLH